MWQTLFDQIKSDKTHSKSHWYGIAIQKSLSILKLTKSISFCIPGVNRKICPICRNSFSGNSALKTHLLTHSKSKSHQCKKCSKKFIDQRTLERHGRTHLGNIIAWPLNLFAFLLSFHFMLFNLQRTNFTSVHCARQRAVEKITFDGMFAIYIQIQMMSCVQFCRRFSKISIKRKLN